MGCREKFEDYLRFLTVGFFVYYDAVGGYVQVELLFFA